MPVRPALIAVLMMFIAALVAGPAAADVTNTPPATLASEGRQVAVAASPRGDVIAVWTRGRGDISIVEAAVADRRGRFGAPFRLSAPGEWGYGPQVELAPDGTAVASWLGRGIPGGDASRAAIVREGTAQPAVSLAPAGATDSPPTLARTPAGVAITWARNSGERSWAIESSVATAGARLGPAELVAEVPYLYAAPRLAYDAAGNAIAVWSDFRSGECSVTAAFRSAGERFGPPTVLSDERMRCAFGPLVATSPNGAATVVWDRTTLEDDARVDGTTRRPGEPFRRAEFLSGRGFASLRGFGLGDLDTDRRGAGIAAWWHSATRSRVDVAIHPPGAAFRRFETVARTRGGAAYPAVAWVGSGRAMVLWRDELDGDHVLRIALRPRAERFGPPRTLSRIAILPKGLPRRARPLAPPVLASPGRGRAVAVWQRADGRVQASFLSAR